MQITKIGSRPSEKGPADWFKGSVRIDPLFSANEARRGASATVTFEPGARTAWHTHPLGQTLIIISGKGWVQKEGGKKEEVYQVMLFGLNRMKSIGMEQLQLMECHTLPYRKISMGK